MSTQLFEQLLATFKKANQLAKQKLATKFGFKTPQEYEDYLKGNISAAPVTPEKAPAKGTSTKGKTKVTGPVEVPTIHNVFILDSSGSMDEGRPISKHKSAIAGINQEITELKKDKTVNYTQTIVDFSNDITTVCSMTPMNDMGTFNSKTRGSTALLQAIGETLEKLLKAANGKDKFLIKIFTDGGENASYGKYASWSLTSKIIKQAEAKGFTVTFVGTKHDVRTMVTRLDVDESNTLVHDNTSAGVTRSFAVGMSATMAYTDSVKKGKNVTKGFYKKLGGIK